VYPYLEQEGGHGGMTGEPKLPLRGPKDSDTSLILP